MIKHFSKKSPQMFSRFHFFSKFVIKILTKARSNLEQSNFIVFSLSKFPSQQCSRSQGII